MAAENPQDAAAEQKAAETKQKFRDALDRKKMRGDNRVAAPGTEPIIHGAHGKAGGKRQFRRKSG